jgi:8-oxo-dGTP pyrophosphatase MutT (NUDIX family)
MLDLPETIPPNARRAARVLVLNEQNELLLLHARDGDGRRWWLAPGGGLHASETFEAAAQRELLEETGLQLAIGRWVWTRHHVYTWRGRQHEQYERFFVARSTDRAVKPVAVDSYVIGHRWWSLSEVEQSTQAFAPCRLASLLPAIISGTYPEPAIDCGV